MERKKQKKKWMRFRHRVITAIGRAVLYPYAKLRFGLQLERFREQGDRPYLIVMNHQTTFDQFFVAMAFRGPVYYIATEDIFSLGWVSKLIRFLAAPIPIKKQTTDVQAVINCVRVAREGGTIALAPEGNRTYSGKTEYIKPAIVKLARALKLPVAVFRIEGGYGVQPRWSDVNRRGTMRAGVSRVIEPEEYKALSDDEFCELLRKELYVNEGCLSGEFHHKKSAEYLERAVYVCPWCGLSTFESHDDVIECKKCGRKIRYLPTKELQGVGFDFPHRFVNDWYDAQSDFINALDVTAFRDEPLYRDRVKLSEVVLYDRKRPLRDETELALYGDRILVGGESEEQILLPFDEVTAVVVLGRNKLNVYHDGRVYQMKGDKRFNALKYVNIYYRYQNIKEGNIDGKFLGL